MLSMEKAKNGEYIFTLTLRDPLNNSAIYEVLIEDINLFEDVDTNIQNLSFESNEIVNETAKEINFKENNNSIISFSWDYNISDLDFSKISIDKQDESATEGSIIISGIDLTSQNQTKTILVDKISSSANRICIKDAEITSITEISSGCDGENEISLTCPSSSGSYTCEIINNTYYKVSGLSHSGIKEYTYTEPTSPPPGGGGGGGGGGGSAYTKPTPPNQTNQTIGTETPPQNETESGAGTTEGESEETVGGAGITGAVIGGILDKGKGIIAIIFIVLIAGGVVGMWIWKRKNKAQVVYAPEETEIENKDEVKEPYWKDLMRKLTDKKK